VAYQLHLEHVTGGCFEGEPVITEGVCRYIVRESDNALRGEALQPLVCLYASGCDQAFLEDLCCADLGYSRARFLAGKGDGNAQQQQEERSNGKSHDASESTTNEFGGE